MAVYRGTGGNDDLPGMGIDNGMDDILWGGPGDDTLSGGGGNDRLIGGPGGDKLNGGPGMDIASYTMSPSGVRVDLQTSFTDDVDQRPAVRGGDAEGDSLTSIETLWGSAFGDILLGNHSGNYLFGNAGDDIIHGRGGNDMLRGGPDNDLLGGDGDDDEAGNDKLYGDQGGDQLKGGTGHDMLYGGMGDDELMGGDDNDYLEGGSGADVLDGGMGMDTAGYTMSGEAVTVDLRYPVSGNPAIQAPMGGHAMGDTLISIENLRGSMHDDMLIGDNMGMAEEADDTTTEEVDESTSRAGNMLFGNMGDDMLQGMGGNDTLHGGKGMDTLHGGADDDKLMGQMGDDELKGQAGNDTLIGGPGADKLYGGTVTDGKPVADEAGMDTADYSGSDMGVRIDLGATSRTTNLPEPTAEGGHAEGDTLHDIQGVTGSAHTDYLVGDKEDNTLKGMGGDDWDDPSTARVTEGGLKGMAGNDLLAGGAGMDKLDGGEGMDDLWGGDGDDLILGGDGDDTPFYVKATDEVTGDNPVPARVANAAVAEDDLDALDLSKATPGTNVQRAGLFGGAGDDTLMGGEGGDYIDGGSGNDTASYARAGASAGVTINLGDADHDGDDSTNEIVNAGGDAANGDNPAADGYAGDVLKNIENLIGSTLADAFYGTAGANMLEGGDGNDTLWGAGGNDTLVAGKGVDVLNGGGGADTFVFEPEGAADSANTVQDFSRKQGDKIDLTAFDLSHAELVDLVNSANAANTTPATAREFTIDLGDADAGLVAGGGTVAITMSDAFTELEVDDFII